MPPPAPIPNYPRTESTDPLTSTFHLLWKTCECIKMNSSVMRTGSRRAEAAEPLEQEETAKAAWNPPHLTETLLIECEEQLGSRTDGDARPDPVRSHTAHANDQISGGWGLQPPERSRKEAKRMLQTTFPDRAAIFSTNPPKTLANKKTPRDRKSEERFKNDSSDLPPYWDQRGGVVSA